MGMIANALVIVALGGWFGQSQGQHQTAQGHDDDKNKSEASSVSSDTAAFLREVSQGNLAEIRLAKIAQSKSDNDDVKKLARRIQRDHENSQELLEQLAKDKHVELPGKVSDEQKETAKHLDDLKNEEFDRAYLSQMDQEHSKDIDAFKQHEGADDREVAVFVKSMLPVLEYHHDRVQDVQERVGK